jgi:hypothetical protein
MASQQRHVRHQQSGTLPRAADPRKLARDRTLATAWTMRSDGGSIIQNAIWLAWRPTIKPGEPQLRPIVKTKRYSRAVYWPSDAVRRAVMAIREARTNDFFIMARVALKSAVRNSDDLTLLQRSIDPQAPCSGCAIRGSMTRQLF